jgi:hypothetical protein
MNKNMLEMMTLVEEKAIETGRLIYLFQLRDGFDYCFNFMPGWLFKVYPGGRKQLSIEGSKLLKQSVTK